MKIMRLIAVSLAVQLVVGVTTFAGTPLGAARPEAQTLRWRTHVIKIAVSSSLTQPNSNIKAGSDVLGALSRGLDGWRKAAGIEFQLEFSDKQGVSPQGRSGDGISLFTIAQSPENLMLFARDPFSEAARTRVFYNRRGFITEADIVLNPFQQFSTDGTYGTFDLETTFAHEIGHLLGLKHSPVMGSLMSPVVTRNAGVRVFEYEAPLLSESDVAAIRSLYPIEHEECCGNVSGRLLLPSGKSARGTLVWAEEGASGRVVSQTETLANGTYDLAGLKNGDYHIYWRRVGEKSASVIGDLGTVSVDKGNTGLGAQRIDVTAPALSLSHVGLDMQLGNSAVEINAGGQYLISIGGKNLDADDLKIEFTSPFITVLPGSVRTDRFGDDVQAVSFLLRVDEETQAGIYSIFVRDRGGRRTALLGAISVRSPLK